MISDRKYILTTNVYHHNRFGKQHTLYQIQAVRDFADIHKGDLGGWVESENNLSQNGNCWVYNDACVFEQAIVCGDSMVCDGATICDHAHIKDSAIICNSAIVKGIAVIKDSAIIHENGIVMGDTIVGGSALIRGDCCLGVIDGSCAYGNTIYTPVRFSHTPIHYILLGPIGSRLDYTTFYTAVDGQIWVETGCFAGTIDEFEDAVINTHKDPKNQKYLTQYMSAIKTAKDILSYPTD